MKRCHNLVTRPKSGTCVDQGYSNLADRIFIDDVECSLTDHNLICCKLKFDIESYTYFETVNIIYDYESIRNYVDQNLPNICDTNNPSEATFNFIKILNEAILRNSSKMRKNK